MFFDNKSDAEILKICQDDYKRRVMIGEVDLSCNEEDIIFLYVFMLKNPTLFEQGEIAKFIDSSVLNIGNSDALVRFIASDYTTLQEKRKFSERLIELKIPQPNFEAARYFNSQKFEETLSENLTDNQKKGVQEKFVKAHCEVIAKSQNIEVNQQCLDKLSLCDKDLHKKAIIAEKNKANLTYWQKCRGGV